MIPPRLVSHPASSFPRRAASLLAGVCAALPLAAAHAADYSTPDYGKFAPESGQYTLEVWSWVGGLDKTAAEFEKAYPNIKVHVNSFGGGDAQYPKMQTAIKAGSGGCDVAQIEYDFLPSFIATDGLLDLSKLGADGVKSAFVPWTWGQVSPDGKAVFGIPQDSGPLALMYNKKIFTQYGLTVPTTWDEFSQQADKLAQASGGKVKMANFYPNSSPWFIGLAWAGGASFFKASGDSWTQSVNNAEANKVLEYWDGLVKKKEVTTIPAFTPEFFNAVGAGQIASTVEAAWGPGVLAASTKGEGSGDWQVAPLPQWTKGGTFHTGNWGGSCNAVLKQSKHPKAATLFAVWLNTNKAPVVGNWNNYGIFPASVSGLASPDLFQPEKDPSKFCAGQNVAAAYADASKAVDVNFAWSPWFAFANDNYNKQISGMLNGQMSPKQALDAWQNETLKNAKADGYEVKTK